MFDFPGQNIMFTSNERKENIRIHLRWLFLKLAIFESDSCFEFEMKSEVREELVCCESTISPHS